MLTCKERHFVGLLAEAPSMKSIASKLSISSRAVEVRRRNVMTKLGLGTSMSCCGSPFLPAAASSGFSAPPTLPRSKSKGQMSCLAVVFDLH